MTDMDINQELTKNCKGKEFAERLEKEVFPNLPDKPTVEQLDRFKIRAQQLYYAYQKAHREATGKFCRGSLIPHRCVVDVYHDALDRLYTIEPMIIPPPPPPRRRRKQPPPPPRPSAEERAATILGEIDATPYGHPQN